MREPFTDGQIRLIRIQDFQYGVNRKEIAYRYGVNPLSVTAILRKRGGKYVYRPDIDIEDRKRILIDALLAQINAVGIGRQSNG